jgi:XRE family aerobic/anaerobic benzoate catabolism transcriptional regulator
VAALATRARELRTVRGWTVEAAAERIGVEPAYVRRLEAGTANVSLAVLVSVGHAYGLALHELLAPKPASERSTLGKRPVTL